MKANIIIQMHRLGDLILTLPLAQKLKQLEPARPLLIIAEPTFYNALLDVVPNIIFLPPHTNILKDMEFNKIINLSYRKESAILASELKAEQFIGQVYEGGNLFVKGFWQLYRTSLTLNSRHNLFHWSDLHALDILDKEEMKFLSFPAPEKKEKTKKIGLFLGASSPLKRPEPAFFAELAQNLLKRGFHPVFLGGEAEKELGAECAKILNNPLLNLTGRFSLKELVLFIKNLDLLITPDTGPMHLAAAYGVPTLNLSLGNVNPYETSVISPKHFILQANISCSGCWECTHNYECKEKFTAQKVASLVHVLLENKSYYPHLNGFNLFETQRKSSLHTLEKIQGNGKETREFLDLFWQNFFLRIAPKTPSFVGKNSDSTFSNKEDILGIQYLTENCPHVLPYFLKEKTKIIQELSIALKQQKLLPLHFWSNHIPMMQIFTSFIQNYLENSSYGKESFIEVFSFIEELEK